MIAFANIRFTNNCGDRLCSPAHYFHWPEQICSIDLRAYHGGPVVFGGGGLFHPGLDKILKSAITSFSHPRIIWSAGSNYHGEIAPIYPEWISKFDLVSVRDFGQQHEYVPCVSCMHPEFDNPSDPTRPFVVYEHAGTPITLYGITDVPKMRNVGGIFSMRKVLAFLGSGSVVITNSYHGAFWSMLLGRPVVIYKPFSNRFHGFEHNPSYCNESNWSDQVASAKAPPAGYLNACRSRNLAFADKVSAFLELDGVSASEL